jgi:hypothetical protein
MPANTHPPSYIKSVVAYQEGKDACFIYVILADVTGAMTSADGVMDVTMFATLSDKETRVYHHNFPVSKASFVTTTVGLGAFEHKALLYPIRRISYENLKLDTQKTTHGRVAVTFTTKDELLNRTATLTGEAKLFY